MPKVTESYRRKKQIKIAYAAKKVFEMKGYTNTSMKDIMLEANIARGTLYTYFNNVEQVFLEVLTLVDNQAFSNVGKDSNITFVDQLDNWINKEVLGLIRQPSLVQARAEYFFSLDTTTFFEKRYNKFIEGITGFLEKGVESGEFCPQKDIRYIAHFMLSFVDGLMLNTSQLGENANHAKYQLDIFHSALYNLLGLDKSK
ncbi:TetR family transcriptional regulator [Paraliobacillus ryukyuensis]|uniref:TetR family transcriptional regulator n=1 Tax=Paraliobacillus ryukyuensis TaxID=200904 RepID=UPI0009A6117A|nr:TetR family transcriptional regulator [Paraliobacillus ryukyuensis]